MINNSFLSITYTASVWIHIVSAALSTFIAFPLGLLSSKGGKFHKRIGRINIILISILIVASFFTLINPLFPNRFALISEQHQWTSFFNSSFYEPAFFLWLDLICFYMMYTAIRVWRRIEFIRKNERHWSAIDIILACVMLIVSLFFLFVGIWDFIFHHPFAFVFVGESLYIISIVLVDFWSFRLSKQYWFLKWGWMFHGFKMIFLWHGLLMGFIIRLNISFETISELSPLSEVACWLCVIMVFLIYRKSIPIVVKLNKKKMLFR